jgi:formylglycine-generating enzyme required for sulfatase activity
MTGGIDLAEVVASYGDDDPTRYIAIADHFLRLEDREAAAAALDRAYGLSPDDADLARHRAAILDELAVEELGIRWRFIPAGTFLMGSTTGDPDERPVHPVQLPAFWIAETRLSWPQYWELGGWTREDGPDYESRDDAFTARESYKIRLQYCQHDADDAGSWHDHAGLFDNQDASVDDRVRYAAKPIVAVSPTEAARIADARSTPTVRYALPTEAQWEKAARGGLVGKRYAWGDAPPTRDRCDFDRMGDYRLLPLRALPPNGYGLYGMCGGVAEWTATYYDALAYCGVENVVVETAIPTPRQRATTAT